MTVNEPSSFVAMECDVMVSKPYEHVSWELFPPDLWNTYGHQDYLHHFLEFYPSDCTGLQLAHVFVSNDISCCMGARCQLLRTVNWWSKLPGWCESLDGEGKLEEIWIPERLMRDSAVVAQGLKVAMFRFLSFPVWYADVFSCPSEFPPAPQMLKPAGWAPESGV